MRHNEKSLSAEGSLRLVFGALFWVTKVYTSYKGITRHQNFTKQNTTSFSLLQ